jgi:uncharacterized protein (TIGR03437 family)
VFGRTAALALFGAICALGQSQLSGGSIRPLVLNKTEYRLRAGESASVDAPTETLDFLLHAKTRRIEIAGQKKRLGFVVGPNPAGDQVLLAAYLALKPGEYRVKLSASNESGEERMTTVDVTLEPMQPVPLNATQPPVILLNGWQFSCPVTVTAPLSASTFGSLESYLSEFDSVPVVYWFDNCQCPDCSIEELGGDLGQAMNLIQYTNGTPVPQVDLIAHSMGGLIVRSYLSGKQVTSGVFSPPANPRVRKAVFIATPHFGSYQAGVADFFSVGGIQTEEMTLGSQFLFDLATWNQFGDDLRGTDAVAIIGNANLGSMGDGVVSLTSASLRFAEPDVRTRIIDYCHISFNLAEALIALCSQPGIADITGPSHPSYGIIQSFLANGTDWEMIGTSPSHDPNLSVSGGLLLANRNTGNQYLTDLTSITATNANLSLTAGPSNSVASLFYDEWVPADTYDFTMRGASETLTGTLTTGAGGGLATFFKEGPVIFSVESSIASSLPGRIVQSGGTITISGTSFGSQQCSSCKVIAAAPGAQTGYALPVSSWTNQTISASLPSASLPPMTLPGLITIYVELSGSSWDSIDVMVAVAPTMSVAPASLQFAYTMGGAIPAEQSIQVTNGGGGTLSWSATASASWLLLASASGTAPSTLSVLGSPGGLSAGTYTGSVQISAAGASNSPVSVPVSLTVTAAPASLAVSPQALMFNYAVGGSAVAPQGISITNTGGGTLSWTASANASWVGLSPASGTAPSTMSVSVNPETLTAGSYSATVLLTAAGATGSPASVSVTLVVQAQQPTVNITAVSNGASFQSGFASATWVSIIGTNLSQTTRPWQNSDFVNGLLPTSLSGVSVTINGLAAYPSYISPTQINALSPDDSAVGAVAVQVNTAQGKSNSFTAQKEQFSPAFFTISGSYVAALHAADYGYVGKQGLIAGVATTPAQPGETILIYGTGFGPSSPPLPSAQLVTTPADLANTVQVTIGGVAAPVSYSGLVGPGLYQFNVTVPNVLNGDAAVVAQVGAVQTQAGALITIQQ